VKKQCEFFCKTTASKKFDVNAH